MEGEPQPGSDGAPEFAPPVAHAALSPVCQGKIGVAFLEPPDVLCVARLPAVGHCSVSTLEGFLIQHPSASVAVPPRLPREVLGVLGEAATVTKQYNFDATVLFVEKSRKIEAGESDKIRKAGARRDTPDKIVDITMT